jgi:EAL domain-containing protein (putative c-di-GMP-specific phosphodiesterase class I)
VTDFRSQDGLIVGGTHFIAFVAARLAALPSPFPDLVVFSLSLPGIAAFRQTYGNEAADELLQWTYRMARRFAPDAVLGELADDSFSILHEFDQAWVSVPDIAAELREAISGHDAGRRLALIAPPSIGAAVHHGPASRGAALELATELHRRAKLAAQLVPVHGQDGFLLYSPAEDERVRSSTVLSQSLRQAVANHEFRLHYQPLVDLRNLEMVGLEALVRWDQPGSGLRQPASFISEAETTGLIVQIGAQVINVAMQQVDDWIGAGWAPPRVAVNISAIQLQDPDLRSVIFGAIALGQVKPENLELELTERTLITWSNAARLLLDELREMGVTVALDDFGTGYSSLQYLKELPISKLKIDASFVRRIASDRRDAALVKVIVGLGEAFGIDVVAEGIEEVAQAEILLECGCTIGQGYLFSRPRPAQQIPALQLALRQRHQEKPSCPHP